MAKLYNEEVIDHFRNPRNVGEVEDASGVGEIVNPACGDTIRLTIRVADDRIEEIKFKALGCAAAVASASKLTEMVKGKSLEEALAVSDKDVAEALGGLPEGKMVCSSFPAQVLRKAIEDYSNGAD